MENEANFPDIDWKGIAKKYENFDFDGSGPLETLMTAGMISENVLKAFKARNSNMAGHIFYASPLQYHLFAEQYGSGNFELINGLMDYTDKLFKDFNQSLSTLDQAQLNMTRAILATKYWSF